MKCDALSGSTYEGIVLRDFRKAVVLLPKREMGAEVVKERLGCASEDVAHKHHVQGLHDGPDATYLLEESFAKAASK